jgi:hypothetical protein
VIKKRKNINRSEIEAAKNKVDTDNPAMAICMACLEAINKND